MKYSRILDFGIVVLAIALLLTFLVIVNVGQATHSRFYDQQVATTGQTSTATSSPRYMTPGTGTSTISMISNAANGGVFDSATMQVFFHASSAAATPSTLTWYYEFSQNGTDWFNESEIHSYNGTTTSVYGTYKAYQWAYASSTLDRYANEIFATRMFTVPTPMRYVRAVFGCAIGGKNCGVWAKFIPQAEE